MTGRFVQTLVETARPRRAVPLAVLTVALLTAEWAASRSLFAVALDAALMLAFVLLAPATWRVLCARDSGRGRASVAGWVAFVALATVVIGIVLSIPPLMNEAWTFVGDPRAFGVLVVLFVVGGWGLGRDIELERDAAWARARAERSAVEAEQAQLLALRAQLDPHFLFNTLNAIAEWCREDPIVAERATLELASILRRLFDALRRPTWTLADELALLEGLAGLYEIRDEARYVFALPDCAMVDDSVPRADARGPFQDAEQASGQPRRSEPRAPSPSGAAGEPASGPGSRMPGSSLRAGVLAYQLPPLLVLPLFENAIKHGPAAGHEGPVSLCVREVGDQLAITIENPGAFRGRREGGEGVSMVERRLSLFDPRASLTLEAVDGRTRATLVLPGSSPGGRGAGEAP